MSAKIVYSGGFTQPTNINVSVDYDYAEVVVFPNTIRAYNNQDRTSHDYGYIVIPGSTTVVCKGATANICILKYYSSNCVEPEIATGTVTATVTGLSIGFESHWSNGNLVDNYQNCSGTVTFYKYNS